MKDRYIKALGLTFVATTIIPLLGYITLQIINGNINLN